MKCKTLSIVCVIIYHVTIIYCPKETLNSCTVEPPKKGQHGNEPFVLSRKVVLFRRFLFISLKMKHFSCLDTNTANKRECNQLRIC